MTFSEILQMPVPAQASSALSSHWESLLCKLLPNENSRGRILLASVGFGDGHNRAAEAFRRIIFQLRPAATVLHVDFLDNGYRDGGSFFRRKYYWLVRRFPHTYHLGYRTAALFAGAIPFFLGGYLRRMKDLARTFEPDLIVSTHVFCAIASQYASGDAKKIVTAGIITDLLDDAFWNRTDLDHYLVGTEPLKEKLVRAKISAARIHVTGIPVDPVFYNRLPRASARQELGLAPDLFTVLIMGGGEGFGPVTAAAWTLAATELPVQVVVIAGRNERLRAELETLKDRSPSPFLIMGFTSRIHDFMDAADMVVTKPGGMTVSECLAKQAPLVLMGEPLPGPETMNEGYLLERGLADKVSSGEELVELIRQRLGEKAVGAK